jgi:glycosyltransferase involved in cell wall biosynthesis
MSMATIGGVLGKVPVIILEETSDPQTRSKKAILLQRVYSMFADMLIGISPSVLDFLRKKVGVSESKSILINNGVQVNEQINSKERKELRFKFGFGQDDIVIGSVGRVHNKIKRFSDLLEAVKLLDESRLKFLLIGSGPDLDSLKQKSKSLKIEKQFVSVGYQSETHNFYGIMDIFCLPSAHEGFGLVAAEAMLHQLPVVATNVGGLKDIVLDNQTGFLVPPFSPDQLAEKLKLLVENPEVRMGFGEMGYQRALKHYTSDRYCQEVENLYVELLKKRGIVT